VSRTEGISCPSAHTRTHTGRNCSLPLDCPGGPLHLRHHAPFVGPAFRFSAVLFSHTVFHTLSVFPPCTPHALCCWIFLALFWLGFIDFICTALATHTRERSEKLGHRIHLIPVNGAFPAGSGDFPIASQYLLAFRCTGIRCRTGSGARCD